jgi:hypothetical protein
MAKTVVVKELEQDEKNRRKAIDDLKDYFREDLKKSILNVNSH